MLRIETIAEGITLYLGDCREILPTLGKVDAVITDPPFGTTQCSWDTVIPFEEMWQGLQTVAGARVPIVLFGCEPFSSLLRLSNLRKFKYDWIWNKPRATGFLNAKKRPMRAHEIISVFCDGLPPYWPQKTTGHERIQSFRSKHQQIDVYGHMAADRYYDSTERYPRSVLTFSVDTPNRSVHPTQKPVALMEYLALTYAKEGDTVLDFTMGSGTTGVGAIRAGRKFKGIEIDAKYFDIACSRVSEELKRPLKPTKAKERPPQESWEDMWARPFEPETR